MTGPNADKYQKDVDRIEKAVRVPIMYAPQEFLHEALEVLPDLPIFREDGTVAYTAGRPDSVYLITRAQQFEIDTNAISEAAARWAVDFVPELTAFETTTAPDGKEVTPEQQRDEAIKNAAERVDVNNTTAEQLTERITKEQNEGTRKAYEGLKYYL